MDQASHTKQHHTFLEWLGFLSKMQKESDEQNYDLEKDPAKRPPKESPVPSHRLSPVQLSLWLWLHHLQLHRPHGQTA